MPRSSNASTRDLLTTPQWEISADFNDAPLGSGVELARNLGVPLPPKMTVEGVVAGSARYRNTEGMGGNLEVLVEIRRQIARLKERFAPDLIHINLFGPSALFHYDTARVHQQRSPN